jgi:hypothetical protein
MISSFKTIIALAGLLVGASGSNAKANCDNNSLQGEYAFKAQGAILGVVDSSGVLQPFASPQQLNAVGQFMFDGNGSFTRVDFAVSNGTPQINASTPLTDDGFRTGQTGTYRVADDCTGTMVVNIPGGTVLDLALALVDQGQAAFAVISHESVPGLPPSIVPAGTSCTSGCDVGPSVSVELTRGLSRRR